MVGILDVGGGMRGVYSAGIYDFFLDKDIRFEYCLGVSAGAGNIITYLAGQRDRNKRFYTDYIHRKEYMSLRNLLRRGMYLDLEYVYHTLSSSTGEDPFGYDAFTRSPAQFHVAATNAKTGRPHYFTNRDVKRDDLSILMASCALPVACKPYPVAGQYYFDGGLAEPVPYQKAFDDGCERLVVVLTRPRDEARAPQGSMGLIKAMLRKYPNIRATLEQRHIKYNRAVSELKQLEAEGRVLIVAPKDIAGMKTLTKDIDAIEKLYRYGYEDGPQIIDFLARGA